ncbi:hypothetical protein [Streptomyces sp. NPDC058595]|uniref:hypothetical protein n=1 Tax=Streptomyces sp. NPDC058595 TaxID=3346550 RepID=UPI003663937E
MRTGSGGWVDARPRMHASTPAEVIWTLLILLIATSATHTALLDNDKVTIGK